LTNAAARRRPKPSGCRQRDHVQRCGTDQRNDLPLRGRHAFERYHYVVVTAIDGTPQRHESAQSDEVSVQTGGSEEAALSNELTARPEQTVAYPTLPDEGGCFIATAAYSEHPSAKPFARWLLAPVVRCKR